MENCYLLLIGTASCLFLYVYQSKLPECKGMTNAIRNSIIILKGKLRLTG